VSPEKIATQESLPVNTKQTHKKVDINTTNNIHNNTRNTRQTAGFSSTAANTLMRRPILNLQNFANKTNINKHSNRNTFPVNFKPQTGAK